MNKNSEVELFRAIQSLRPAVVSFTYDNDGNVTYLDMSGAVIYVGDIMDEAIILANDNLSDCEKCTANQITAMSLFGSFLTSSNEIPVTWQMPMGQEPVTGSIPSLPMMYEMQFMTFAMNGMVVNWRGEFVQNRIYQVGDGVTCGEGCFVSIKPNNVSLNIDLDDWVRCKDCCCVNEY